MRQLLKRLRCEHEYRLVRNIGGDEINALGGKRSECECTKCGKCVLWDYLDGEGLVKEEEKRAEWDLLSVQYLLNAPPKAVMTAFVDDSIGTHDDNACAALKYYDERADRVPFPPRLMEEVAKKFGTTPTAMKEHWRCIPEERRK